MGKHDIVIIGAGPGGYVAAIRVAQLGGKVCLVEKDQVGGVCLNRGCIPTKCLIRSVEVLREIKEAPRYGLQVDGWRFDYAKAMRRCQGVVGRLRSGISSLLKARNIDLVKGAGRIVEGGVEVTLDDGKIERVLADKTIVATGSRPYELPNLRFDEANVISSDDALQLEATPKSILIVGGGVIGCEFAGIFNGLGSEVTIVEMMKQILPTEDIEVARRLQASFKQRGIKTLVGTKVENIERKAGVMVAELSTGKTVEAEKVLVCVGRKANIEDIGLEAVGVEVDKGWVKVNEHLTTNLPHIYAIGDVIGGYLLAHVASAEGIVAAECAMGKARRIDYKAVPNCIFTHPQIASCGLTEAMAKEAGYDVRVGKFPFTALGKAQAVGEVEGFIKLVGDAKSDRLLGAQIIGTRATDLIAELVLAIRCEATVSKVAETIHAHPTFAEAITEAAHSLHGRSIHSLD